MTTTAPQTTRSGECEYPIYLNEIDGAMEYIDTPNWEIDEDGIVVTCGQLDSRYGSNKGNDEVGEYIGNQGSWYGYADIGFGGFIMRRS